MAHPLTPVFERCEREQIRYCVLRDAAESEALVSGGEVDLLVDPDHVERLERVLAEGGYARLASWGRSPHRFFIRYDAAADRWIKCDLVTSVAYGRPIHSLRTTLGEACLEQRRQVGATYAPCAEDELVTLVLHEMLDKGGFRPHRAARLQELCREIRRPERLSAHLGRYWPGMTWRALCGAIQRGDWARLMADRQVVAGAIADRDRLRTAGRETRDRLLRSLHRTVGLVAPHAPSLALLAPDGAGKSTLVAGIENRFFGPVCSVYMGLYQKNSAGRVPTRRFGVVSLLMTQWRRYLHARSRQASGQLVLYDRYSFDALLPGRGTTNMLRRLRRWLLAWTIPAPDITVVLDAPGDMLFARKGEHSVELLEQQRQSYLRLVDRVPRAAVINAQRGPDEVRRAVTALIWERYRRKAG